MDKNLEKNLTKIVIITNEAGDIIVNPDVVKIIKDHGFCVISDAMAKKLLDESLELGKLKRELKHGKQSSN